jgi:N-acetylneuraminate synthase/N,N'-diacetyllegionaminate synthase
MQTLAAAFGCPVGFSDHTDGIEAAIGAVALGACWIEKHFTTDRGLPGPDHRFSSDPAEFAALVKAIRRIELNLGTGIVGPAESEMVGRHDFRLSCVAAHDLPAFHVLTATDIAYRRPGNGLAPGQSSWLIGMRTNQPVKKGTVFSSQVFSGG